ncbi:MAG: TonB family protein [Oligoflexia bacterium]
MNSEALHAPLLLQRSFQRSLKRSLLIHLCVVAAWAIVTFAPRVFTQLSLTQDVPFEVIEAPQVAPLPLQPTTRPKPPSTQPRAVFGMSRKSLTADDAQSPDAKAGNTLAKTPDTTKLKDSDADSLPIPTDDYLVSQMPVLLGDFRVPYPADARKAGIQGAVLMDLLIDAQGRVRQAQVIRPLFPSLDQAALEAAKNLVFKPASVAEQAVAVRIRYAYRFVLE